jgi:LacI family transcriptional regulator, repressor for deo operon, udp, cdd, tsx, nupC, and nupG
MKRHQVTIVDIARQLNISKSTVSRALTGHPRVHEQTREAVLKLAGQLDYQRNMLAINLSSSQSRTIGIIVPEFVTSFFPLVILGAQEIAAQAGYTVLISQSNEQYETEVANARVMLANRVDGVLVSLTRETQNYDHLAIFQRKAIPMVFFNRVCYDIDVPRVIVDDYEGAFAATEHLIQIGKKRIAHLAGPPSLYISRKRLEGYKDALRKHDFPIIDELIISYDLNIDRAKIYVKYLLDLPQPPDALFAVNDPTALEALLIIKARGLSMPDQMAVVGFSNDYGSSLVEPGLTTVAQPTLEIGRVAAQLLIEQINTETASWKSVTRVLKTELLIRGSTARGPVGESS